MAEQEMPRLRVEAVCGFEVHIAARETPPAPPSAGAAGAAVWVLDDPCPGCGHLVGNCQCAAGEAG